MIESQFHTLWPKSSILPSSKIEKFEFELFVDPALTQAPKEDPEDLVDDEVEKQDIGVFSETASQEKVAQEEQEKKELIEQEKRHAYEEGFEKGKKLGHHQALEEASQSLEANINQCLQKLEKILDDTFSNQDKQKKELTYQVITFAKKVLTKCFPVMEEKFGQMQVEEMVANVLKEQKPSSLILEIHPRVAESLKQKFSKHFQERHISVETEERMGLSDCKLSWEQGGVERHLEKIFQEIELLFKGFEGILHEH